MFQVTEELEKQLEKQFNHQIKAKRIKKEFHLFSELQDAAVQLEPPVFNSIGIIIPFTYTGSKLYRFEIRVDREYPFNKPQIHSLDKVEYYGEARDLLMLYLNKINLQWGPSRMLKDFLEMVPQIVKMIQQNHNKLLGHYFQGEMYTVQELQKKGLTVFVVNQVISGIIRNKLIPKKIAVSRNYILLFADNEKAENLINLQWFCKIRDIKNVYTDNKNFESKFQMQFEADKQKPLVVTKCIRAKSKQELDKILCFLNPMEMLQKKAEELQISNKRSQQLVQLYTSLVGHYSIHDKTKYAKYMQKMKKAIEQVYKK